MLKNIAAALVAVVLLAGCSSSSTGRQGASSSVASEFERVVGDKVFFAYDSASLSTEAKSTLMRQAVWLTEHKTFNLTVEGHCDERGTREYNIALGERRAAAVKNFLTSQGVESARIETVSYGKERPAVMGTNEEAWSKNRRGVTAIR